MRDALGRFISFGMTGGFVSETDRHIVDYPTGHGSLSVLASVRPISSYIPGAEHIDYAETPFFDDLQILQGDAAPGTVTGKQNAALRDALFRAAPILSVGINDLVFTQPNVSAATIDYLSRKAELTSESMHSHPVYLVQSGRRFFLMDGHHRTVAWYVKHNNEVAGHVISADDLAVMSRVSLPSGDRTVKEA